MASRKAKWIKTSSLRGYESMYPCHSAVRTSSATSAALFDCGLYSGQPFVLSSLSNWSGETALERGERLSEKEKEWKGRFLKRLKESGGITDMVCSGYFLDSDSGGHYTGEFYRETIILGWPHEESQMCF